jgi:hypothetical protein
LGTLWISRLQWSSGRHWSFCGGIILLHEQNIELKWDFHEAGNIVVMLLYLGLANYLGNGRTPGKWVARIRAVSLTGERMGLWQSGERALGYGAAVLEGGLGFVQFFWDPNRMCAQDRLAETIVVDERVGKKLHAVDADLKLQELPSSDFLTGDQLGRNDE